MKLRADELDRQQDALNEREVLIEKGQQIFMTHVEAKLRDKDAEVETRVANAKDELAKDYRDKLAKAESRYVMKLDEVNREKDQIQGEKEYAIQEMEKKLADLQEKLEKA